MAGLHRWHHRVSHCTYTYNFPSVIMYIFMIILCSSVVPISSATVKMEVEVVVLRAYRPITGP